MALAEEAARNIIWFLICSRIAFLVFHLSQTYSLLSWQSLNAASPLALHWFSFLCMLTVRESSLSFFICNCDPKCQFVTALYLPRPPKLYVFVQRPITKSCKTSMTWNDMTCDMKTMKIYSLELTECDGATQDVWQNPVWRTQSSLCPTGSFKNPEVPEFPRLFLSLLWVDTFSLQCFESRWWNTGKNLVAKPHVIRGLTLCLCLAPPARAAAGRSASGLLWGSLGHSRWQLPNFLRC